MAIKYYFDGKVHRTQFSELEIQEKPHLANSVSLIYFFDDLEMTEDMEIWKYNTILETLERFGDSDAHAEEVAQWFASQAPGCTLFFAELRSL